MTTKTSGDFLTNRAWLSDIINGDNIILRCGSALEFLQMFVGYVNEKEIDVYARVKGEYDNINYRIVESFDDIDYFKKDNTLCTTFTQTINDMLADFEHADELAPPKRSVIITTKTVKPLTDCLSNLKIKQFLKI